jgi:hypothetical protein
LTAVVIMQQFCGAVLTLAPVTSSKLLARLCGNFHNLGDEQCDGMDVESC